MCSIALRQERRNEKRISLCGGGAFRAKASVEFGSGCPTLVNDAELSSCTVKYIEELHGSNMVFTAKQFAEMASKKSSKNAGSEDFAYISHEIPTIMLAMAAGNPKDGYLYPLHHPKVLFDEKVLPFGAAIYAFVAMR
ncbi:MAG: amidohydrolase, partial [Clostridia bacterium]|nr:amidohydrolase [Clostridia bacterium]